MLKTSSYVYGLLFAIIYNKVYKLLSSAGTGERGNILSIVRETNADKYESGERGILNARSSSTKEWHLATERSLLIMAQIRDVGVRKAIKLCRLPLIADKSKDLCCALSA